MGFSLSRRMILFLASPTVLIFISSNFVNAGNLVYNVIFSRLMGPELFGDLSAVLTLQLAIFGVLTALQLAVSQRTAATSDTDRAALDQTLARLNLVSFWGLAIALQVILFAVFASDLSEQIGLSSPWLLVAILSSLPFTAPLAILRGIALGRLRVNAVILSSNLEMLIRLVGGLLAWQTGLGLTGVAATVPFSIVAAWFTLRQELPVAPRINPVPSIPCRGLFLAALPFAMLQFCQVALLDGDVLAAKALLDVTDAGNAAALILFQRIQFFGCSGIIAFLLPSVTAILASGGLPLDRFRPSAILFCAVSIFFLTGITFFPGTLMNMLVGPAFVGAVPILWMAGTCATAFTLSFLLATFLAGLNDRVGIWLIAMAVPVQIVAILKAAHDPTFTLQALYEIKLCVQLLLVASLMARSIWTLGQYRSSPG